MTPATLQITNAARELSKEGVPDAGRDAQKLMAVALGIEPSRMVLHMSDVLTLEQYEAFWIMVARRLAREPLSHILGERVFFKHRFKVGPQVLDPRPETEVLVEAALKVKAAHILDLGTGSGAILLSLLAERSGVRGTGTDVSPEAIALAQENAEALAVSERAVFVQSDWFDAVTGRFDLIVSNPPYIAAEEMDGLAPELSHEPRGALTDEGDGLSAYRAITEGGSAHLEPGGWLMVEIGPTQGAAVAEMFSRAGLESVAVHPDLDGRDRVVMGKMPRETG
ncbi:peptide chain release factor N(5)-glutamine methyltransferase [Rhodobacteraceae bacterium D3-12]|nr:peptide chain release factor N(5)-glutamine methyltransferase [Rhodobacteraceae bacterium D3-12]